MKEKTTYRQNPPVPIDKGLVNTLDLWHLGRKTVASVAKIFSKANLWHFSKQTHLTKMDEKSSEC